MADQFDKFTERALRVLALSQEEALRFNHNYIGTEHLLLGLIREDAGVAAQALRFLGVELNKARSAVEFIIGNGDRPVKGEMSLTPRAKKAIELAVDEARRLNQDYIGTEHILLALIREGEGIACGVLESLGVPLDRVRRAVIHALQGREELTPVSGRVRDAQSEFAAREEIEVSQVDLAKLTPAASRVLSLAHEEALRFNHDYVGTEHLLLGLIRDESATASLKSLHVDVNKVRTAIEFIIGRGHVTFTGGIGLTPRAVMTIELAGNEARRMNQDYIAPAHLLLGLMREGEGIAAGVLESLGVSLDKARHAVGSAVVRDSAKDIDGKAIAEQVRAEVTQRAKRLKDERGVTPGLALVLVGDNPSSLSYVRSKGDTAEQAGLYSDMFHFPESTDETRIVSHIQDLNADARFHGILVQLPLPKHMREDVVIGAIEPHKDADGVTSTSLGLLLRGEPTCWPATPAGIVELLHRSGHPPAGKHVVVCGRSNIVGKPIAAILMQKNDRANATVTLCHTGTPDISVHTRQADILIAAMGVAGAITADIVKPGAVVIDVGNNWIEDPTRKSGRRLVGDVDYESVRQVASAITPVPGGVGPMTIAMLLSNTVWLAERYGNTGGQA